jgi:hypothetical protein
MISNKWVIKYLLEILSNGNSTLDKDIKYKSIGEFTLFCFLLKRDNLLIPDYLNLVRKMNGLDYKEYKGKKYIKGLICLCLETIALDKKKEIKKEFNSIEELYFISVFHKINSNSSWDKAIIEFICLTQREGLNIASLYNLTHLVFYSSDFGHSDYWTKVNQKLMSIILDIIEVGITKCKRFKNWDLLVELYLSLIFIHREQIFNLQDEMCKCIHFNKSKFGWYLSDGDNLKFYEENFNTLNINHVYCIFHTTLVTELLLKELQIHLNAIENN